MKNYRPTSLFTVLSVTPILLCLPCRATVFCSGLTGESTSPLAVAQQFYGRLVGHWVGATLSRIGGTEPVSGYFHLVVTRMDENTFREENIFYRVAPKSAALERSGTQSDLSTIESNGVIHRRCRGSGTVLIDF